MPGQDLIVAIDAGSSSMRAVLFDRDGRALRQSQRGLEEAAGDVTAESDAEALAGAALDAVAALEAPAGRVAALGVTAALGLVLADRDGRALGPAIGWRDRRATAEAAEIETMLGRDRVRAITGRRIDAELTAAKLRWLGRHRPALLGQARTAHALKDWLVFKLCGAIATDPTSASYSMLYDVRAGAWSVPLIEALGLPPHLFAPVGEATSVAGVLSPQAAARTGLAAGTPVAIGGPDGTMGAVGGGLVRPGVAVDVIGTTDVVLVHAAAPLPDAAAHALVVNRFPAGTAWSIGGPMLATGGAVAWFADLLGGDRDRLTEEAARVPPGADGVLAFPALAGSRAPRWDAAERGALTGLGFGHGRGHVFRAVLEGCAAEVAAMFDALADAGVPLAEVRVVGGGTASALSLQIRAAMLGRPLIVPEVVEASALGVAMAASVAVGLHADLAGAERRMVRLAARIEPDAEWAGQYAMMRRRHAALRPPAA